MAAVHSSIVVSKVFNLHALVGFWITYLVAVTLVVVVVGAAKVVVGFDVVVVEAIVVGTAVVT